MPGGIRGLSEEIRTNLELFASLYCVPDDVRDLCYGKIEIDVPTEYEASLNYEELTMAEYKARAESEKEYMSEASSFEQLDPFTSPPAMEKEESSTQTTTTTTTHHHAPPRMPRKKQPAEPPAPKSSVGLHGSSQEHSFMPRQLTVSETGSPAHAVKIVISPYVIPSGQTKPRFQKRVPVSPKTTVQQLGEHVVWCMESEWGTKVDHAVISFSAANLDLTDTSRTLEECRIINAIVNVTVKDLKFSIKDLGDDDYDDDDDDDDDDDAKQNPSAASEAAASDDAKASATSPEEQPSL